MRFCCVRRPARRWPTQKPDVFNASVMQGRPQRPGLRRWSTGQGPGPDGCRSGLAEPRRVCRTLIKFGYAAMDPVSGAAQKVASVLATKPGSEPGNPPEPRHTLRHKIGNTFAGLKDWHRIATGHDRCPILVLSVCAQAATVMRPEPCGHHPGGAAIMARLPISPYSAAFAAAGLFGCSVQFP